MVSMGLKFAKKLLGTTSAHEIGLKYSRRISDNQNGLQLGMLYLRYRKC